ncbi:MAG: guanylate kinase [Oscillospiraceae bacterium]|nr:guanylate kinase [Oscillospiraceae bacterium]
MKQGRIIIVSGPSGVGKGTVLKEVMQDDPTLRFSVSATTRTIRPGEIDGVHYFFIDKPRFEAMLANNEMLEHAQYAGNYYGTPEKAVDDALAQGISVVLEIEVQGALQVMERRPDAISIFIAPPSFEELERRLTCRGDTPPEVAAERLRIAVQECKNAPHYQYTIVNDTVSAAAAKIRAILTAEACRSEYTTIQLKEDE